MEKTPKNNRTLNTSVGSSSPVHGVNINSGRPAPGHSNLTGNARVLKDTVVEVYNCMQKWKICQADACTVISSIYSYRMQYPGVCFSDKMNELVRKLKSIYDQMDAIMAEFYIKQKNALAVVELEKYNPIRSQTDCAPLFISWSTQKFYQTIDKIVQAYSNEHQLHQSLLLRIIDDNMQSNMLFYLSCWTFQPYLDHDVEKQMDYMIKDMRILK